MLKKLLLADDSLTIQKVVGIVFANLNYQLLIADNGDEALALARKEFPDLVIADIGMPGKDGLELCRDIKNDPGLSQIPVLLLPGTFENFDEKKALAAGADGWLTKPFESQSLITKVEDLLAAASAQAPSMATAAMVSDQPVAFEDTIAEDEEKGQTFESVGFDAPDFFEDESVSFETPEPFAVEAPPELETFDSPDAENINPLDELSSAADNIVSFASPEPASVATPINFDIPAVEESSSDAGDDIWDAVTFEEEDLRSEINSLSIADEKVDDLISFDTPAEIESAPVDEDPALVDEEPTLVDEEPTLVEEEPALVEEEPALVEEEPALVEEEPALVEEEPAMVEEEPALVEEEPALVEEEPALVEEEPALVEEEPALVEEEPALVDEDLDDDILELGEEDIFELEDDAVIEESSADLPASTPDDFEFPDSPVETIVDFAAPSHVEPVAEVEPAAVEVSGDIVSEFPDYEDAFEENLDDEFAFSDEPSLIDKVDTPAPDTDQIAAQLAKLDPSVLEDIVKRVAGPVIERLATRMLEEIIWEVVPDLAESMIKDEIRKIKDGAA
ncbi:response regulator [Geopsychrobacter electrodiphilus]|uniref:response regulator n=1 Tax=Geopsychrobacter electrodiphilus TaxID=225196 RepID=UPI000367F32C|nr:response regulator [Geopsychrobacter electrodiphilus]